MQQPSAIVIGAGIVGLATARALAIKGYRVKVFERSSKAIGASIRNFGMVWPIGQPNGKLYDRALRSRSIWKELCERGNIWHEAAGSLHLAYHTDEKKVLEELYEIFKKERPVAFLSSDAVLQKTEAVVAKGLCGALYSNTELIVDPRQAIETLPALLAECYKIEFFWNKCVSYISDGFAYVGNDEEYEADLVFICSGADFETLYPEVYAAWPITKCKLQMMRLATQPQDWRIGPALCGGLSLIHYKSFLEAPSLLQLKERYANTMADYLDWGIHVMVAQNGLGELTIGDSHEYGLTHDPFDRETINQLILSYLKQFAQFKSWQLQQSWNGIYAKHTDGETEIFFSPEPGVYVINALGGAGMTLSFGLAEELVSGL
ncbi:MAG: TIGR03364 family FAD-dependent oxidoreductase [Sphingobacteriales bacterium]|nr:MAG: TIGR03364 family FAD-dependent oxidoreductase [Sphingobacteriales bacterium]